MTTKVLHRLPSMTTGQHFGGAKAQGLVSRSLIKLFGTLVVWQEREQQRRHLAATDDRLLQDMGMSSAQAAAEAGKPFWRG